MSGPNEIIFSDKDKTRFLHYIKVLSKDECWEWIGPRFSTGYGQFVIRLDGRYISYAAHRVAAHLWIDKVPTDLLVLHRCDNPPCCNPNHLFIGTQSDNIKDAFEKGRHTIPKPPRQKLTEKQALTIRNSKDQTRTLVKEYGVSRQQIIRIRNGSTWKHV